MKPKNHGSYGDRFPKRNFVGCQGCGRIANLRLCWGCDGWFCEDCLIEHMMGCEDWKEKKDDYEILFECDKHEVCDDCDLRFKCLTRRKNLKKGKEDGNN